MLILITCVIKDDGKFYPQILLKEALFIKYAQCKAENSCL